MEIHTNIVKVAVDTPDGRQLYNFDQNRKLKDIVNELSKQAANSKDLALLLTDSQTYINEGNRKEVKDGALLQLVTDPVVKVTTTLADIRKPVPPASAFLGLSEITANQTLSEEFVRKGGVHHIIRNVENGKCTKETLEHALKAVLDLLDNNTNWDEVLKKEFIVQIVKYLSVSSETENTYLYSLGILEGSISNSQRLYMLLKQLDFSMRDLKKYINRSTNQDIQTRALSVVNAFLAKCPTITDERTPSRGGISYSVVGDIRQCVLNHIVRSTNKVSLDMAHQLHVFQALLLNMLQRKMNTKANPQDRNQKECIIELARLAFDSLGDNSTGAHRRPSTVIILNEKEAKNLGFQNSENPLLDFEESPPGILTLECMKYFASNQQNNYIRLVLENSSRSSKNPFAKSSIALVKMLCNLLKVGEPPLDTGDKYFPILFTHDHIFEEIYCIAITLLNKTWKEMNAKTEDFDKVIGVVTEQMALALNAKPNSVDQCKTKLQTLSYNEILRIRQTDSHAKEKFVAKAKPVLELQERIKPELLLLIKEQRINALKNGAVFQRITSKKSRTKLQWFCRLSKNQKYLYHSELENQSNPSKIEKIFISEIIEVLTGKNCPHMKNYKVPNELAFSIHFEPDDYLNFVAPDKEVWCLWIDGLSIVTGGVMDSELIKSDMDTLVTMQMKLQLLEIETIPIPDKPPPIPQSPTHFNFAIKF